MGAIVTVSNAEKNSAHAKDNGISRQAKVSEKDMGIIRNLIKP